MATIEKRVRNGETSYRARYRTPAGVQRSKVFARKIDAERFLTTVEAAKLTGAFIDPALSKATVREWAHQWLDGQAHVKPTTYARYEGIVRKHLDPVWGHVPLGKVTHSDVQAWITAVSKTHSPSSVRKMHRVLSLVLDMAVKDGRLVRNVAKGVNLPRPVKHEHRYLTHGQVDALADAIAHPTDVSKHVPLADRQRDAYRLIVLFLAYTGLRWGEMAALRVGRLQLARRRAVIVESVTPVAGQGLVWGTPKTHQRREVPIPRFLLADLEAHVRGKTTDQLVFTGVRGGEVLRVSTFSTALATAAEAIGVPGLHPHELRHTAASLAIAAGADVKVVQQMLGHASATMTMDTYGHLFEDRLDEISDAMDAAREANRFRLPSAAPLGVSEPNSPDSEDGL